MVLVGRVSFSFAGSRLGRQRSHRNFNTDAPHTFLTLAVDEYAWERAFERSWDFVEEDDAGLLRTEGLERQQRASRG